MTTTTTDTGTPTTWALDHPNAYGETRAEAIERAADAVSSIGYAVEQCAESIYCEGREDAERARRDLATIREGSTAEFSLDGRDVWTWTILADSATEAAGRAVDADCHA